MHVQESYFNSGLQTGENFTGSVEECADFLIELDTEDGKSLNDWTKEEAVTALERCLDEKEALYIDGAGDRQHWLTVTD